MRAFFAFTLWLVAVCSVQATSIIFPKFSEPIFQKDRLFFTSPDGQRALCVGVDGKKLWEKSFKNPVRLIPGPESELLLQVGKTVQKVSPSGELTPRFDVESENDRVSYLAAGDLFISQDSRFNVRNLKVLDASTGKPLWKSTQIENIALATPEALIGLAAERIPTGGGYRYGKTWLEAYDRNTFEKKWTKSLAEDFGSPYFDAAYKAPYLVFVQGRDTLVVLDAASGRTVKKKEVLVPSYGGISGLEVHGEHLVWLTSMMVFQDFDKSWYPLHFCKLPDLAEVETIRLEAKEVAHVTFAGEFIITDALYRTAGYRRNGEKVWDHSQMDHTDVIDGKIYFSDFDNGTARLGSIEVATGNETILYSEPVKEPRFDH